MAYTRYRLPVLFPLSSLVLSLSLSLPFFFSPSYHSIFGLMGRRLLGNFAYRVLQAIIWASTPKSSFFQTLNDGQSISRRETVDVTNRETSFHKHSLFFSLFPLHTKRGFSPLFFFEHRLFQNYPFLWNSQISIFQKNFSRWSGDRNNSKCNNSIMYIPFSRGGGRNR